MEKLRSLHEKYPRLSIWAFVYLWPIFLLTIIVFTKALPLVALGANEGLILLGFATYLPPFIALGYLPAIKIWGAGGWVIITLFYLISGTIFFYYYALILWVLVHGPIRL